MDDQTALEEVIVEMCRTGDAASLRSILAQSPQTDLNFNTDGGITLLMHAILGIGESVLFIHLFFFLILNIWTVRFCVIMRDLNSMAAKSYLIVVPTRGIRHRSGLF